MCHGIGLSIWTHQYFLQVSHTLLTTSGMQGGGLLTGIRGGVPVYGPGDKSHGCYLSTEVSVYLSRSINSSSHSPVMHPHLQRLLRMWKLTNLLLSADGLTTLIPSVPLSGKRPGAQSHWPEI